jgi:hypothetical protein
MYWLIALLISTASLLVNGEIDLIFILKPLRQILLIILIYKIVKSYKISTKDFFKIVIIAALINSIVIYIQIIAHNFFGMTEFLLSSSFDSEVNTSFRKPGLMAGYPHSGLFNLVGAISLFYFKKNISVLRFSALFSVLFLTLILTSRTALLLGLLILPVLFISKMRQFKTWKILSIIFLFLLSLLIWVKNYLPEDVINVAFEVFINYKETKQISTASTDALYSSYDFPLKASTWIFGNGKFMKTDSGNNLDDGFHILLFGVGIFGLCIYYGIFFRLYFYLKKNSKSLLEGSIYFILFFVILISNIKADTIFSRLFSEILYFFLFTSYVSTKSLEKNN